jgi:hypothetical protein
MFVEQVAAGVGPQPLSAPSGLVGEAGWESAEQLEEFRSLVGLKNER